MPSRRKNINFGPDRLGCSPTFICGVTARKSLSLSEPVSIVCGQWFLCGCVGKGIGSVKWIQFLDHGSGSSRDQYYLFLLERIISGWKLASVGGLER